MGRVKRRCFDTPILVEGVDRYHLVVIDRSLYGNPPCARGPFSLQIERRQQHLKLCLLWKIALTDVSNRIASEKTQAIEQDTKVGDMLAPGWSYGSSSLIESDRSGDDVHGEHRPNHNIRRSFHSIFTSTTIHFHSAGDHQSTFCIMEKRSTSREREQRQLRRLPEHLRNKKNYRRVHRLAIKKRKATSFPRITWRFSKGTSYTMPVASDSRETCDNGLLMVKKCRWSLWRAIGLCIRQGLWPIKNHGWEKMPGDRPAGQSE